MQYETESALTAHRREVEAGDVHVSTRVNPLLAERAYYLLEESFSINQDEGLLVSERERDELITYAIHEIVQSDVIGYPPELEDDLKILQLATDFYKMYLEDTSFSRESVVTAFVKLLLTELKVKHLSNISDEDIERLKETVMKLDEEQSKEKQQQEVPATQGELVSVH